MKKVLAILLVLGVVFACFAGGAAEAPKQESNVQAAIRDAQTLTWDQLLAKAKAEIGDNELSIYSNSSRLNETTFTEKTGIKVKADQPDDTQVYEKMEAEIGNGLYGADVYALQDSYMLMNFAIANGYLENFIPMEYKGSMDASATDPLVICYFSRLFIYNNGKGNLKNLITNIWQVTEPEFKGIEMKSPLLEKGSMNFLITVTSPEWQEKLAKAYKSYYGKDWVNDGKFENISYEWIYKFINNCTFINKDSTIAKDIASGAEGSVGFFVYSKLRSVDYTTLAVSATEGVEGFSGLVYPFYGMVAANAKYPYTACLYLTYLMSSEGYNAIFGKDMGTYSTNKTTKISDNAKDAGDRELDFWLGTTVVEDRDYIPTVYAQAYTKIAEWCASK